MVGLSENTINDMTERGGGKSGERQSSGEKHKQEDNITFEGKDERKLKQNIC